MIQLYEWQKRDEENGLIMSWLTHDSLDAIKKINMTNKVVLSFGAGYGDAWLANRCKKLYVVERYEEWIIKASEICGMNGISNIEYLHRPCNDSSGFDEMYCAIPEGVSPDVIIVDDAYRYECIVKALSLKRSLTLIVDNWDQDYVFICPAAEEILEPFKKEIYPQKDHINHEGNCWKTLIAHIQ
jgi:hypothetical protein